MEAIKPYLSEKIFIDPALIAQAQAEWKLNHRNEFYLPDSPLGTGLPIPDTKSYFLRLVDDTYLFSLFPTIREIIEEVGKIKTKRGSWAELGRVFISEMAPNTRFVEQRDTGEYHDKFHRHHLDLESNGFYYCWKEGTILIRSGDCFRVNNSAYHWCLNNNWPRTHVVFDAY